MTSEALDLDLDLDLWEAGDLTRDEVVRRHGEEVAGLLDLFGRLESVAIEAAPYEEARWEALRSRLPGPAKPRRRPSFRAIALAAAAVLLLGAVAYAAVPTVRRQVNQVTQQVFGDPQQPAPSFVKTTPAPASNPTGVSAIPTQSGNDQSSDDDQNTGGDQGSGDDENAGDNQGGGDNQNNGDDQTSGSGSDETGSANDEGSGGGSQGTSSDDSSTDDGQDQSSGDQAGGGTDQDG